MTQSLNALLRAKLGHIDDTSEYDEHNRALAINCMPIIEQYMNGLITDYELLINLASFGNRARVPNVGKLDCATGLKYKPQTVMAYRGVSGKVGFDGLE
jgi:hypothetical protein